MSTFLGSPADGTLELKGGSISVRTTDNYVWAGINTDQHFGEYSFKAYLAFDTSAIPVGSIIHSANCRLLVDASVSTPDGIAVPIQLQHSPWALPLDSDDWEIANPPSGGVEGYTISVPTGVSNYSITYQITNLSIITSGGLTTFRLALGAKPPGVTRSYVRIWSGDSGNKPVLNVDFTPPMGPNLHASLVCAGALQVTTSHNPPLVLSAWPQVLGRLTAQLGPPGEGLPVLVSLLTEGKLVVLYDVENVPYESSLSVLGNMWAQIEADGEQVPSGLVASLGALGRLSAILVTTGVSGSNLTASLAIAGRLAAMLVRGGAGDFVVGVARRYEVLATVVMERIFATKTCIPGVFPTVFDILAAPFQRNRNLSVFMPIAFDITPLTIQKLTTASVRTSVDIRVAVREEIS